MGTKSPGAWETGPWERGHGGRGQGCGAQGEPGVTCRHDTRWEGVNTARPVAAPSGGSPEAGPQRLGWDAQPPTAAAENGLHSGVGGRGV